MFPTEANNLAKDAGLEVGSKIFHLQEYELRPVPEGDRESSPGQMTTSSDHQAIKRYAESTKLVGKYLDPKCTIPLPYAALDIVNGEPFGFWGKSVEEQDQYAQSHAVLTDQTWSVAPEVKDLWRYAALAADLGTEDKIKSKFKKDSLMVCVRGFAPEKKGGKFTWGPGKYSTSFLTNGQDGRVIVPFEQMLQKQPALIDQLSAGEAEELKQISTKLLQKYEIGTTIGDVIASKFGGEVPTYNDGLYNNSIGVAALVISGEEKAEDRSVIFVVRDKRHVSVDTAGFYFTASGAVEWDSELLSKEDRLQVGLASEVHREISEEIGLHGGVHTAGSTTPNNYLLGSMQSVISREVGLRAGEVILKCEGAFAELTRGGKPEFIFSARAQEPIDPLMKRIVEYAGSGKKEIYKIFTMPVCEAMDLIRTSGAASRVHPKLALGLLASEQTLIQGA